MSPKQPEEYTALDIMVALGDATGTMPALSADTEVVTETEAGVEVVRQLRPTYKKYAAFKAKLEEKNKKAVEAMMQQSMMGFMGPMDMMGDPMMGRTYQPKMIWCPHFGEKVEIWRSRDRGFSLG